MFKFFKIKQRLGFTPLEILNDKISTGQNNTRRSKFLTGFTLIELLVVIAIIGVLATIVLVSLNTARMKARNARRESDIRQLSLALGMFYDSQSPVAYPTAAQGLAILVTNGYFTVLPTDPSTSANYTYTPAGAPPATYCLTAALEGGPPAGFYATQNGTGVSTTLVDCTPA